MTGVGNFPALPRLADALGQAEEASVTEAFAHLARHCAVALTKHGYAEEARDFEQWVEKLTDEATEEARRVLGQSDSPYERLAAWFRIRSFDHTTRRQQLSEMLEQQLKADFPQIATSAPDWLRRGLSPQAAFVRALAALGLDEDGAAGLAGWVRRERTRLDELRQTVSTADERTASEADFEIRTRRDFHFRVLFGITEPHDLTRLEASDAPLALAVGYVWAGAPGDDLDLAQGLANFAYSGREAHEGLRLLERHLAPQPGAQPSVHFAADGG